VWRDSATLSREALQIAASPDSPNDLRVIRLSADGKFLAIAERDEQRVLVLSADGALRRKFGAKGSGPGEFRSISGIAWLPNRSIIVRDMVLNRAIVFDSNGKAISQHSTPVGEMIGPRAVTVASNGSIFFGSTGPARNRTETSHFEIYEFNGMSNEVGRTSIPLRLSTMCPTVRLTSPGNPVLGQAPAVIWTISKDGFLVAGCSAKYEFDVFQRNGKVMRIGRTYLAIRRPNAEREQIITKFTTLMRAEIPSWAWSGPSVPANMPSYSAIFSALDGRFWIVTPRASVWVTNADGQGEWKSRWGFDLFANDGAYLGPVTIPIDLKLTVAPAILGDTLWGATETETGATSLTKFILKIPNK